MKSAERSAFRSFGGPRNFVQDSRPPQKPPKADTSVLVHECFDQHGGENQPEDCGCTERVGRLESDSLIRRSCADFLVIVRYGKRESKRDAIVLRRDYVAKRLLKLKINSRKLLPAILKHGSILSFKKGIIRSKNGTAIELEMNRTDAQYWNNVLVQVGLSLSAGMFLKDAALGMGVPASFTSLENFQMAPVTTTDGLDPTINAVLAETIQERKEGVFRARHRVRPRGTARDSDERAGEVHETTGQMNIQNEPRNSDDARTLPELLDDPDKPEG
jgi:hypothetical protein